MSEFNDWEIEKSLEKQIKIAGRLKFKKELGELFSSEGNVFSERKTIGETLLGEIKQAAFSERKIINHGDIPISQNTLDDFLDIDE